MSKLDVSKAAVYLYIETISLMFSSYILLSILTKTTTVEVIGTSSAVVSMAGIFTTVVIIGVPSGVQRFLGKKFSEQGLEDAKMYIKASTFLVSLGIFITTIVILIVREWISVAFKIDGSLIIISVILIAASAISTLLRSIIISSLKTRILPIASVVSTIVKIFAAVVLVFMGTGALGVTTSFAVAPVVSSGILVIAIFSMISKVSKCGLQINFFQACKDMLVASMASWIPGLIATIGSQLGLIVVLGWHGAEQAGVYSITFSIVLGISTGMSVLSAIAFPALGAMSDGRKRFAWRIVKLSLAVTLPFSSSLIFYSPEIMGLFGPGYVKGAVMLQVLLLSMLPTAITGVVSTLVYSYGNYRQVLEIGLATTVPRIALYFLLVPFYGGVGAALSYDGGSIAVLMVSLIIARKVRMRIFWKDIIFLFAIPLASAFLLSLFSVNYVLGIFLTLVISYTIFLKMLILTRTDVQDVLGFLPPNISNPMVRYVTAIATKLNGRF